MGGAATGDVVVVTTPHVQVTLNDARALLDVSSGATVLSVESGEAVYRSPGGGGKLGAGAHVTIEAPKPVAVAAPAADSVAPTPKPSPSSLAAETALYHRAQKARAGGAHDEAVKVLREYQALYPAGLFAPEVSLALMGSLQARGELSEAAAEAGHFLERFPDEPQAARVKVWRKELEGSR
ncbi:MAG: outer membrane protein assembly factor BamD [Myxococcaceae bacterium]|nr:outer membrane protein assembly factor BamD [Myxococcaceae bacterium]